MNFALAFPIPRELASAWLRLEATDTDVAMSPLVGTGKVLFIQWVEGRAGYRFLRRLSASFRESHRVSAVVFKPVGPEVRRLATRLGAFHLSTDGEKEERWVFAGEKADRWLALGKPIPGLVVETGPCSESARIG